MSLAAIEKRTGVVARELMRRIEHSAMFDEVDHPASTGDESGAMSFAVRKNGHTYFVRVTEYV